MRNATRALILFLLSIAAMIVIKVWDLHALLTILLVIPLTLVALTSILSFLIGIAPASTKPKCR